MRKEHEYCLTESQATSTLFRINLKTHLFPLCFVLHAETSVLSGESRAFGKKHSPKWIHLEKNNKTTTTKRRFRVVVRTDETELFKNDGVFLVMAGHVTRSTRWTTTTFRFHPPLRLYSLGFLQLHVFVCPRKQPGAFPQHCRIHLKTWNVNKPCRKWHRPKLLTCLLTHSIFM